MQGVVLEKVIDDSMVKHGSPHWVICYLLIIDFGGIVKKINANYVRPLSGDEDIQARESWSNELNLNLNAIFEIAGQKSAPKIKQKEIFKG